MDVNGVYKPSNITGDMGTWAVSQVMVWIPSRHHGCFNTHSNGLMTWMNGNYILIYIYIDIYI